jgi:outer membrane protein
MHARYLLIALLLIAAAGLTAQTKVAHVDIQRLFESIPDVQAVKDSLAKQQSLLEQQGTAMLDDYNTARQSYEKRRQNMSEADRKAKEDELSQKEQQIMAFRENGQNMLEQKSKKMLKPVKERVEKAIADVAKDNGYDYVLDNTEDAVRYASPAHDITDLVLAKMGVKLTK